MTVAWRSILVLAAVGSWWAFATGNDLIGLLMVILFTLLLIGDAASSPRMRRLTKRFVSRS